MAPSKRGHRLGRADGGASGIEYAAVVVLAGVILAGVGHLVVNSGITENVSPAVCELFGGEDCGAQEERGEADGPSDGVLDGLDKRFNIGTRDGSDDADDSDGKGEKKPRCQGRKKEQGETEKDKEFKPEQCEKLYEKEYSKSTYSMWFVQLSNEFGFIRQEYSDGTVRLTAASADSIGVEVEGGLNVFKSGGVELGGKIGGGLETKFGDTYVFDSKKEADAEIDKIKSWYEKKNFDDARGRSKACIDNPSANGCITGDKDKGKPFQEEPAITTKSVGGKGSLSLNFGSVNGGGKKKSDGEKSSEKSLSLGLLGGEGSLAGETVEEVDKTDPKDPKTSRTYSFTVEGAGSGGLLNGKGTKNVALKLTHDKKGELVGVEMSEAVESPKGAGFNAEFAGEVGPVNGSYGKKERKGRYDARTASFEVTDDNREMVEEWLTGEDADKAGVGDRADEIGEHVDLDDDSSPWDRVKNEFYDHGKVSKVLYDTEYESENAGWGVSFLGMDFGVATEWGRESREAIDADYLGAPDDEKPRRWLDFLECMNRAPAKPVRVPGCPEAD